MQANKYEYSKFYIELFHSRLTCIPKAVEYIFSVAAVLHRP